MLDIPIRKFPVRHLALIAITATSVACSDSDPVGPEEEAFGTLTVDASTAWTFVDLGTTASQVQVGDPASSNAWDIAFFAAGVMLNGGAAGPGDVEGYCLCLNADATDEQVMAMTSESERATFETVTAADIPVGDWVADDLVPAIDGWWSYNMTTHVITPVTDKVWIVGTAEGGAFAKLRVAGFINATQQSAGEVTLEFAIQTAAGQPYGETRSLTVDLSGGGVYVDLLDGAVSDEADWDLFLEGYDIRLNGGVSGSGEASAVEVGNDFNDVPDAFTVPAGFAADEFGGVFEAHPWYRYNLLGDDHQIWPTYNVYLVRIAGEIYKIQLVNYYDPIDATKTRRISFRYAKLTN